MGNRIEEIYNNQHISPNLAKKIVTFVKKSERINSYLRLKYEEIPYRFRAERKVI